MAESGVPAAKASHSSRFVCVFDCRPLCKGITKKVLDVGGKNYKQFLSAVRKCFCALETPDPSDYTDN
ncbi:structural maintenance of chromosomes flexible hinge domain-containing protein 1 [Tachysurus ichikawai]